MTIFYIYNQNTNVCLGYVSTIDEALKILTDGEGLYRYDEKDINDMDNEIQQTCYENIFG